MTLYTRLLVSAAALALIAASGSTGRAADDGGLTIYESSEVLIKPTQMEIDVTSQGEAELTADAVVKYRQAGRATVEALRNLGIKGLSIDHRGVQLSSSTPGKGMGMMMPGAAAQAPKGSYRASATLRVTVSLADLNEQQAAEAAAKIIDTAKDTGGKTGEPDSSNFLAMAMASQQGLKPIVRFVVPDARKARQKALRQAYDMARARASEWATATGTAIGKLLALEEITADSAPAAANQAQMIATMYGAQPEAGATIQMTSNHYGSIPVQVKIKARFALKE